MSCSRVIETKPDFAAATDGIDRSMQEIRFGEWHGGSRSLFWCACLDPDCAYRDMYPRRHFDKGAVTFEQIQPEILCDDEVVGRILVLRIKELGCTCVIESDRITSTILPGGLGHPCLDDPHIDLLHYYFRTHYDVGFEVVENLMIDKEFFDKYEMEVEDDRKIF